MTTEMNEGAVCMPNIGRQERAKRMRFGMISGGIAVVAGGAAIATHAPWWARGLVFLPAVMAAYGVFQAREQT
jgi:hypothetical protein